MIINSENATKIDSYLKDNDEAELGKWPIELSGEKKIVRFYKFPLKLLYYNINNGRFATEKRKLEKDIGRELNSLDKEDAKQIKDVLLGIFPDKTKALKEDIRKKGQMEPGVITFDGFVINGNRRMAIFEDLHIDEPTGKWEYLEAIRLRPDISPKDLWKLEVGLQLSKEKKADYSPVNELLKIKEGYEAGLKPEEIAAAMYDWTPEEVENSLERLRLIENFLIYFRQEENYGFIQEFGLHEYFINLQKYILMGAKKRGTKRQEIQREIEGAFQMIFDSALMQKDTKKKKRGITHQNIRKLGKIYSDTYTKETYFGELPTKKKKKVGDVFEAFKSAEETMEMIEKRNEPLKLVTTAIKALQNIDTKSKHFIKEEVKKKLYDLNNEVAKLLRKFKN